MSTRVMQKLMHQKLATAFGNWVISQRAIFTERKISESAHDIAAYKEQVEILQEHLAREVASSQVKCPSFVIFVQSVVNTTEYGIFRLCC